MKKIILIFLTMFFIALGFISYQIISFVYSPSTDENKDVIVFIDKGSFLHIALQLEQKNIVGDAKKFSMLATVLRQASKVKRGEYLLNTNMKPKDVLAVLTSGKSIMYSFTVKEGANILDISQIIEEKGLGSKSVFLNLCKDKSFIKNELKENLESFEGYLFPDTYQVTRLTTEKEMIAIMVKRFLENYRKAELETGIKNQNRHDVIKLASIIEKETGAPQERPVISSVYTNRLKVGMKLQADPTVLYGIFDRTGEWKKNITREDLTSMNRYNTYAIPGLPYGPIANPGIESIKAALKPAESSFIFFVSKNDGTHQFSIDLKDHNKAVQAFQKNPEARKGKSWRDLKKSAYK